MINVFSKLAEEAKPEKTGGEAGFFLATVATADSNGITFIPDGQTAATQKKYKMIASGPMPVEGDRVVVMKHSGTCVVLGIIGMPDEPVTDEYVLKTGDTMSGALDIKNNLNLDSTSYEVGTRPASNIADRLLTFKDKNGTILAKLQDVFFANGEIGLELATSRQINDSSYGPMLRMTVNESGNSSITLSPASAWRSALGLGTSGAFPLTIAQGGSGNTATYYTTTVSNICTASSDLTITSAQFASWGKLASVMIAGTWTRTTTTSGWINAFTMNSDKRPKFEAMARAWSGSSTYLYPSGIMYRSGTITSGASETLFCTYLIA